MAYVDEGFKTFTNVAAAIPAGTAVKLSTAFNIVPATAATDVIIGVVHGAIALGTVAKPIPASVRLRSAAGTGQMTAGGTITLGAAITANAAGLGVVTSTAGNQVIGYALEAVASGATFEFIPSTGKF